MQLTLRTKLFALAATVAVAFAVIIVSNAVFSQRVSQELARIQALYLPKVELRRLLERELENLSRAFQDAVAAHDQDALARAREFREQIMGHVRELGEATGSTEIEELRAAIEDYYQTAHAVSMRLIARETGEPLLEAVGEMQVKQKRTNELLAATTSFDRGELSGAFNAAALAQKAATQTGLAVSMACMALMLTLIIGLGRGLLRAVTSVTIGLERFGTGKFDEHIWVPGNDELATVANRANQMAVNLKRLADERDRADWLKAGQAGLVDIIRGELEPEVVANRAATFLADYLEAPAAALYYRDRSRSLRLMGAHAADPSSVPVERFEPREGLVGQAAVQEELLVIQDPPRGYLRVRSGLGEATPSALVLLPLVQMGSVKGVLELALFKPFTAAVRELLMTVREALTIAMEVSLARAQTRQLLAETQQQAGRLARQEEELRATNEELQSQREELTQANEELTQTNEELEVQRRMLEERNHELEQVRRSLEQQKRELATVSDYKSQFLTNMSHELRTPLNSMLLLSSLLSENTDQNLSDKQIEFCKTIHSAGKDLLALINQVLDLAKIEAGKHELHVEPVALREFTSRAQRVFEPLAKDKGLTLRVQLAPDLPEQIHTDRQRVDQIVTNLLGNAIKFTERGEVSLVVGPVDQAIRFKTPGLHPSRSVAFTVTDTGSGIRPEHRERIFAPFEQVDARADRRHGGTGLGLAIARELALLLGGELLLLRSTPGTGSTFVLYLPYRAPEQAEEPTPEPVRSAPPPRPAPQPPRENVEPLLLLIEDDKVFADAFGEVIRAQGLKHVVAPDGETGLKLARELNPTGILLDVKLPDMNGFAVMEQLSADPATAGIPVHFVSALDGAERGMAMGAVGYLSKPSNRSELVSAVQSLRASSSLASSRILVVEDESVIGDSLVKQLTDEALEVVWVSSAAAALQALENERFGCVILDLSLPDMDGLDLLSVVQLRQGPRMPAVLIYTARALSKTETKRLEAYADAIVLKDGQSSERLMAEVRLFVRRLKEGLGLRRGQVPAVIPPQQAVANLKLEGKKVLIVDDDMRTVYALSAMLRAKGMQVVVADTGRVGLEMLEANADVDAVLMDIMMPEMDGYEAMRRLRADPRWTKMPVIALTAKSMKGDAEKCLQAGASAYLSKPIDANLLLPMLNAQLVHEA